MNGNKIVLTLAAFVFAAAWAATAQAVPPGTDECPSDSERVHVTGNDESQDADRNGDGWVCRKEKPNGDVQFKDNVRHDKGGKLIVEKERFMRQFRSKTAILEAKVLATDPKRDLCLLQLPKLPAGVEGLPLAKQSVQVGERVHSVGNPGTTMPIRPRPRLT